MRNLLTAAALMIVLAFRTGTSLGEETAKPAAGKTQAEAAATEKPVFQPMTLDPEMIKQSMQARSELEQLNRKILARQTKLYEENGRVRELRETMRSLQRKIDAILDEDKELKALKEKLNSVSPALPVGLKKPDVPPASKKETPPVQPTKQP